MPATTHHHDQPDIASFAPPPRSRLWRIGDVAAFLTVSENTAWALLRDVLPHPIAVTGRVRLWWPTQFDAWAAAAADLEAPPAPSMTTAAPAVQLWRFADVAEFLTLCDNTARAFVDAADDTPAALITSDRLKLWHPCQWQTWAAHRAGLVVPKSDDIDEEMRFFS